MSLKHEILLNSFNRPVMINEALRSIFEQRYLDPENVLIRVLDDGSQDEVQDIILKILEDSPFPYKFTSCEVDDEDRYLQARYAIHINEALETSLKENDDPRKVVIHYFTDDSVMFPNKIQRHERYHKLGAQIVYNSTMGTNCKIVGGHVARQAIQGLIRRPPHIGVGEESKALKAGPPYNFIDHISLSHKLSLMHLIEKPWWDTNLEAWHAGDWLFWTKLAALNLEFDHIDEILDEKIWHEGCLQWISEHEKGLKSGSVARSKLRE